MTSEKLSPEDARMYDILSAAGAAITCGSCGHVDGFQTFCYGLPHNECRCPACGVHVRRVPFFEPWDADRRWPRIRLEIVQAKKEAA